MKAIFLTISMLCVINACSAQTPVMVQDINVGKNGSSRYFGPMIVWNGKLYFSAVDDSIGRIPYQLFSYDELGPVKKVFPTPAAPFFLLPNGIGTFGIFGNKLYMNGGSLTSYSSQLMSYSSTGAIAVAAFINSDSTSSNPYGFITFNNKLYFGAEKATKFTSEGAELYKYDGVNPPLRTKINTANNPGGSFPRYFSVYRGKLYFAARPGASLFLLMQLDTISNLAPAKGASGLTDPGQGVLASVNATGGIMYFTATSTGYGRELWSYDGDTAIRLTDLAPGPKAGALSYTAPVVYNGRIYFAGSTDSLNFQLYAYNPADGKTALVYPVTMGGPREIGLSLMIVYKNELYFTGFAPATGFELWKYDGSTCALYADICAGRDSAFSFLDVYNRLTQFDPTFTIYNNHLYFRARDSAHGVELWRLGALPSGVQQASWSGEAGIHPNPATATATLDITLQSAQQLRVFLTDVSGRAIFTTGLQRYAGGKNKVDIPLQQIAAGPYFYRVSDISNRTVATGTVVRQ